MSDAPLQLVALAMFAEINARLDGGEPRASVLTEKGLTESEFHQEQQRWLNLLAAQAREQQWQLQQRYSALYAQWRLKDNEYTPPVAQSPGAELSGYTSTSGGKHASEPLDASVSPLHPSSHHSGAFGAARSYGTADRSIEAQAPAFQAPAFLPEPPPHQAPAFLSDHSSTPSLGSSPNRASFAGREFSAVAEGGGLYGTPSPAASPTPLPHVPPASTFTGTTLSFEQLTCLTAELDVNPAKASPVLAGYGVDQASYDAQHRALRARCEGDFDLQQRYDRLLTYYRAVVSQR